MHSRILLILACILMPPTAGVMPAPGGEGISVTGHAKLNIKSSGDDSFSATTVASFTLANADACDEKACKTASSKAAEKIVALFPDIGRMTKAVTLMSECQCSNGSTFRWEASCDKLQGLARRLCYDSPH